MRSSGGRDGLTKATRRVKYDGFFAADLHGHDYSACRPGRVDGTFDANRPFFYVVRDREPFNCMGGHC
jgi:hypothetical protein